MSYLAGAADQSGDAGMHSNESTEDRCSRHYTLLQRCPAARAARSAAARGDPCVRRRLRDKDVLFLKHDPEDFIGLVLGGHLYTVLYGPDGRELIVNDIRPGEVIGETALIQPNRRETSAYASGAASVLILHRRHFAPLIADTEFLARWPSSVRACAKPPVSSRGSACIAWSRAWRAISWPAWRANSPRPARRYRPTRAS